MQASLSSTGAAALAAARVVLGGEVIALSGSVERRDALSLGVATSEIERSEFCSAYGMGVLPVDDLTPSARSATKGCYIVDHRQDWKELAHVLDRLYFWLMLVLMTVSSLIIGLVPYYKNYF
jgi:hypothetical protein